jgi:hypothetical protein
MQAIQYLSESCNASKKQLWVLLVEDGACFFRAVDPDRECRGALVRLKKDGGCELKIWRRVTAIYAANCLSSGPMGARMMARDGATSAGLAPHAPFPSTAPKINIFSHEIVAHPHLHRKTAPVNIMHPFEPSVTSEEAKTCWQPVEQ